MSNQEKDVYELKAAFDASGDPEDGARWLSACRRLGLIEDDQISTAASIGYAPAESIFPRNDDVVLVSFFTALNQFEGTYAHLAGMAMYLELIKRDAIKTRCSCDSENWRSAKFIVESLTKARL